MKTVVLYREKSEQHQPVDAFVHDCEALHGMKIERVELDSREGAALVQLYGVTDYPAVLVTRADGQLVEMWQGMQLPAVQEVQRAAHQ